MKKLRIYVDTSVIGGCFDEDFEQESRALIQMLKRGELEIVASELLLQELESAPEHVKHGLGEIPSENMKAAYITHEAESLRDAYISLKVAGKSQANDALHVALASVAKVDMIVSWNFKHIVHYDKIRGFNAVNLREGYLPIEIRSPLEVV